MQSVSRLSTKSVGSRRELVANCVHTADATQLDSFVASASAVRIGHKTAKTRNSKRRITSSLTQSWWSKSEQLYDRAKSPVFSLLRKTGSDGDARIDSGGLFQTDAAAAGQARSPMIARRVRGATMADVGLLEERSHRRALRSETRWRSEAR